MLTNFEKYREFLDALRQVREGDGDREQQSQLAEDMDELWSQMSPADQLRARGESWRAWPDEYFKRVDEYREVEIWSSGRLDQPPREAFIGGS